MHTAAALAMQTKSEENCPLQNESTNNACRMTGLIYFNVVHNEEQKFGDKWLITLLFQLFAGFFHHYWVSPIIIKLFLLCCIFGVLHKMM